MARGKHVVAVSALEALARAGLNATGPIATWMDAQRGEVFAALYAADGRDLLIPAVAAAPAVVLDDWGAAATPLPSVCIGDGAVRHAGLVRGRLGPGVVILPPPSLAGVIGQIAAEQPERAAVPHAIVPIYVRKSDAELARARRATPR